MAKLELSKKYRPYNVYTETGVGWLGKVPSDWKLMPLRAVLKERKEKNKKLVSDNILSVMKDVGVIRYADKGDVGNKSSSRPENYKIVHEGDIVVNSMNLVIGSVGQAKEMGVTSSVYLIYYPKDESVNVSFYSYLFRSKSFQKHMSRYGKGIMELREAIKPMDLKTQLLPKPDKSTQDKVVTFLDEKTKAIDAVIEKRQLQIELLKERRTAMINYAVTRGVEKQQLVDSGIEWMGQIPKGWNASSLKTLLVSRITDGPHTTPTLIEDGVEFISAESIQADNTIDFNKRRGFISRDKHEEYCKKACPQRDDIFMVKSGATTGRVAIVETDKEFSIWSPLALIRVDKKKADAKFIYYFLQSNLFQDQVRVSWSYGTQQNIGMRVIENLQVVYPDKEHQQKIATYLDGIMPTYSLMLEKIETSIVKLQEFKSSLISHAVTGKIKI